MLYVAGLLLGQGPVGDSATAADRSCSSRPLPPALESAGFGGERWPRGETIRFSAAPSFSRLSWAVQVHRPEGGDGSASVHVVKLVRQWSCNRHTREGEWTGTLPAREAARFFARSEQLERKADEEDRSVMVTDGTLFEFGHKRAERVYRGRLSAGAQGNSGELSRLVLDVAARFVGGGLPTTPDWTQSSRLSDVAFQAHEAACGSTVFRARYRNVSGPRRRGHVEEVTIGGQSLPRAAEQLDIRAGRRFISGIDIRECDTDGAQPIFRGVLRLPEPESRARGLSWNNDFTIRRGPEGWSLTFE